MGICNEEEEGEWMRDKEQNKERPDTRLYMYIKAPCQQMAKLALAKAVPTPH